VPPVDYILCRYGVVSPSETSSKEIQSSAQPLYSTVSMQPKSHNLHISLNPTRLISSDTADIWATHELIVYCAASRTKQEFGATVVGLRYWHTGPCFCG